MGDSDDDLGDPIDDVCDDNAISAFDVLNGIPDADARSVRRKYETMKDAYSAAPEIQTYERPELDTPLNCIEMMVVDAEMAVKPLFKSNLDDPSVSHDWPSSPQQQQPSASWMKRSRATYEVKSPLVPTVILYGVTRAGCSVSAELYGFYPAFRLRLVAGTMGPTTLSRMCAYMESVIRPGAIRNPSRSIVSSKMVRGFPASPYVAQPVDFMEFRLASPRHVRFLAEHFAKNPELSDSEGVSINGSEPVIIVAPYSGDDPLTQFMVDCGMTGFGWVKIENAAINAKPLDPEEPDIVDDTPATTASVNVVASVRNLTVLSTVEEIAPIRVAAIDIECLKEAGLPDARKHKIIIIGVMAVVCENATVPSFLGPDDVKTEKCKRIVFAWSDKDVEPVERADSNFIYSNEMDMLIAFGSFVHTFDPDVLLGHNIIGFDIPYIVTRANALGLDILSELGRRTLSYKGKWNAPREIIRIRKNGEVRKSLRVDTPGRIQLDTLPMMQASSKESSYKLGSLASKWLGEGKDDVGYNMIGPLFVTSSETRRRLCEYCLKDVELSLGLAAHKKLEMVMGMVTLARETRVQASKLLRSGNQEKVKTLVLHMSKTPGFDIEGHEVFFPFEIPKSREKDDKFQGASVLRPTRGYSGTSEPVAVGDFKSLYPSIMISHNMCYCTELTAESGDDKQSVEHDTAPDTGAKFVKGSVRQGLLPAILKHLLASRDAAKLAMKKATNPAVKKMYDSRQLGLKIIANSVYGVLSASGGWFVRMIMGESVTSWGRAMIGQARLIASSAPFNGKIIYGDSVTSDTPMFMRFNDRIVLSRIDELWDSLDVSVILRGDGKEEAIINFHLEVWSDTGFTRVVKMIRHRCESDIWRVCTHTGVVDCTADHSLIRIDGQPVKPIEVCNGESLMHSDDSVLISGVASQLIDSVVTDVDEAYIMGMFAAEGTCGTYSYPSGIKNSWKISGASLDLLMETQRKAPFETRIYDTIESSGAYALNAIGNVKALVSKYRKMFYNSHAEKKIPDEIMVASIPVVQGFWDGFYAGDGDVASRIYQKTCRIDQKGKQVTSGLIILARRLGYNVSINVRKDKPNIFRLNMTMGSFRKNPNAIKKSYILRNATEAQPEYVYDLETVSHHFHVAPGNLVVHNTDSIMIKFPDCDTVDKAFVKLKDVCAAVTKSFPAPVELQPEKVYCPHLQLGKKRYFGLCHIPGDKPKVDSKGLEKNRLDNCPLVRKMMEKVFDILMVQNDLPGALAYIHSKAAELIQGKIPYADLVVTKSISKPEYAGKMVHVEVAKRMQARDPSYLMAPGERIPYVIIVPENMGPIGRVGSKSGKRNDDVKLFDRAEDPLWAIQHNMQIDVTYYLQKQLAGPLARIFMWFIADKSELSAIRTLEERGSKFLESSKEAEAIAKMTKKMIDDLTDKIGMKLLGPSSFNDIKRPPQKRSGSICKFLTPSIVASTGVSEKRAVLDAELAACRDQCTKCRGYEDTRVQCVQRDCTNLFELARITRDIEDLNISI